MSAPQCTDLCTTSPPTNVILFNTFCIFRNNTFTNCQEACLDSGYQFNSPKTIRGCDQFSAIRNFDQAATSIQLKCNETYVNLILDLFNGCMNQYCEEDNVDKDLGGCPAKSVEFASAMCGASIDSGSGVMKTILTMADSGTADVCKSLVRTVNADIGGVGVFIAYALQISLLGYLLLGIAMTRPLRRLVRHILKNWQKQRKQSLIARRTDRSQRYLTYLGPTISKLGTFLEEHYKLLEETAEDLQDSQCFLMIAGQVALIVALFAHSDHFDARSFYQLENNYLLATLIVESTVLPVASLLVLLKITGKATSYIYVVSIITLIFSFITFIAVLRKNSQRGTLLSNDPPDLPPVQSIAQLDKCGFNSPPVVFCTPDYNMVIDSFIFVWPLAIAYPVLRVLWLGQPIIWKWLSTRLEMVGIRSRERSNNLGMTKLRQFVPRLAFLEFPTLLLGYFVLMLLFPRQIFASLWGNGALENTTFTIAQIIAAMVFAPVICRYLYNTAGSFYQIFFSKKEETHGEDGEKKNCEKRKKHYKRIKRPRAFHSRSHRHQHSQPIPKHESDSDNEHYKGAEHYEYENKSEHKKKQKPKRHWWRDMLSLDSSSSSFSSSSDESQEMIMAGALMNRTKSSTGTNVSMKVDAVASNSADRDQFGQLYRQGRPTGHERWPSYSSYQSANTDSPLLSGTATHVATTPLMTGEGDGRPGPSGYLDNPVSSPSSQGSQHASGHVWPGRSSPNGSSTNLVPGEQTPTNTRPPSGPDQSNSSYLDTAGFHSYSPNSDGNYERIE